MAKFSEPREDANKGKSKLASIIASFDVDRATDQIMSANKVNEPPGRLASRIQAFDVNRATDQIMTANANATAGPVATDFGNSRLGQRLTNTRAALQSTPMYGEGELGQRIADYNISKVAEYGTGTVARKIRQRRKVTAKLGDGPLSQRIKKFRKGTLPPSADNSFSGLTRFLSSFGDKLKGLIGGSRNKIAVPDPIAAVEMKDRALNALIANTQTAIRNAFDKYSQGRIDKKQFAQEMEMQIRRQALGAAIIGVEGTGNLTPNVIEAIRGVVAQQLAYLDGFIRDIEGRPTTNRDRARALQYGNAAFSTAQTAMRQFDLDGAKGSNQELEEKRVLGAADEHCDDCLELATDDWEPFGTLPVPGSGTICGSNCRCELVRRYKEDSTPNPTQ